MACNNQNLGRHWQQFINQEISSGRYHSEEEVIRDALRTLEERKLNNAFDSELSHLNATHCLTAQDPEEFWIIDHIIHDQS